MFEKIKAILADQLGIDPNIITPDTNIKDDLKADSLSRVELIFTLEEETGIRIPDEEAEKLNVVKDLIAFIEKNT